jgi:transcriptional regulator GlxA family with amidase domain
MPAQAGYRAMQAKTACESNRDGSRDSAPGPINLVSGGLAPWRAKRALNFIETNLGSRMMIQDVADAVSLSTSHLSRAFKRSFGCTPMAYVAARRVERAALLITSTAEKLSAIALACGFVDQSHLNRNFRRALGTSPARWRRMRVGLAD